MELIGEIQDIIYYNETNSYMIAEFETEDEQTTIVGYLPFINTGDSIKIIGNFVEHKKYGRQFKVETFEKMMPQTVGALEKYLANGNVKGVGKAIAKRIVAKFGEDTINIFKTQPQRLAEVKGISESGAMEIAESFLENWEVWQIVGFLEKFGIGAEFAKKVYELLGLNAIQQIESNPYILIDISRGVDFKQIDKMALDLGINYDNNKRIESGIKYSLIRATYNGNSCVIKENLIQFVVSLLDVTSENVEYGLKELQAKDEIVIEKRGEKDIWIYLSNFYYTEQEIAIRIKRLQNSANAKKIKNIDVILKKIELNSNIELSEKQVEAIKEVNENNVTIITGGPGTGKTTIIKSIIDIYEQKGNKVVLCAPTGRAAKKMTETTGKEASTLHRLLEIGKIDENDFYKTNAEYEGAPIDADLIIVDELSMVDMFVMSYLLKCVYKGTKLILVGDCDQLSSVGPGSILEDLIESEKVVTIHLDKIFRQAAKSKIILNAHRVNNGEPFISKEDEEYTEETMNDFFYINEQSQEKTLNEILSLCTGRLKNYGDYDFFQNIQVLTPTKKGLLGTRELNKALQEKLNPNIYNYPEKSNMGAVYRVGDRIMQVKNNYDIDWERKDGIGKVEIGKGVFNGEIGTITEVSEKNKIIEIKFDDDKTAYYDYTELEQIEHSYAITIHKAQRK